MQQNNARLRRIIKRKKSTLFLVGGLLGFIVFVGFLFLFFFNNKKDLNFIDLPSIGNLPSLSISMNQSNILEQRVEALMALDGAYLFVNDRDVNGRVADIIFLWMGLTPEDIKQGKGKAAVEIFLRRLYGLPDDEPIENNPLLGADPWPRFFNDTKAKLLIQGGGKDVYGGEAFYDFLNNKIIIEGKISKNFVKNFAEFLNTQDQATRTRLKNNFLGFINATKGLKTLTPDERKTLQMLP